MSWWPTLLSEIFNGPKANQRGFKAFIAGTNILIMPYATSASVRYPLKQDDRIK